MMGMQVSGSGGLSLFRGRRIQLMGNRPPIGGHKSSAAHLQMTAPVGGFAMFKRIPLTQGKVAIVDEVDHKWLSQWKWYAAKGTSTYYARRSVWENGKTREIQMHRAILDAPPDMEGDHINGDGLDNRRANLRLCTQSQQRMNAKKQANCTSKYKGVTWDKRRQKWSVLIVCRGQRDWRGYFDDEQEAARAYNIGARKWFGDFAKSNVIEKEERCRH